MYYFVVFWLFKNSFRNAIRVSDGLNPDQDQHSVGPDLGPKLFAKMSTKEAASK